MKFDKIGLQAFIVSCYLILFVILDYSITQLLQPDTLANIPKLIGLLIPTSIMSIVLFYIIYDTTRLIKTKGA